MSLTEPQLKAAIEYFTILAQIDRRLKMEQKHADMSGRADEGIAKEEGA